MALSGRKRDKAERIGTTIPKPTVLLSRVPALPLLLKDLINNNFCKL
jgi:hypothetical protein